MLGGFKKAAGAMQRRYEKLAAPNMEVSHGGLAVTEKQEKKPAEATGEPKPQHGGGRGPTRKGQTY